MILKHYILKANRNVRLFLLAVFLSLFSGWASGQPVPDLTIAWQQFLNLEFDSCRQTLNKPPAHPHRFYLHALLDAAEVFLADDGQFYKTHKNREAELLDELKARAFSSQYETFLRSEIKLQWAVLKMKYSDEFSAFWSLKQAYKLATANTEEHPGFSPSYKTQGLLHVLYGIFPYKYQWVLTLFGLEGDVNRGLSELNKVYENNGIFSLESGMTIALLSAYLLNDAEKGAKLMHEIYDKNRGELVSYAYASVLMKNSRSANAWDIVNTPRERPWKLPYFEYLKGEILLQKGDTNEATRHFLQFIKLQNGQNLIKDAYYKTGLCYYLNGDMSTAQTYFETAKQKGRAKNEADKYAQNSLESGILSDRNLYRLRFATDGGFYEKAWQIQKEIDPTLLDRHDRCEYHYRTARLLHKTGKINEAVKWYRQTVEEQNAEHWYFAPNSALQLALLYRDEGNNEKSMEWLKRIDDYKGYPYESSIRQKAKSIMGELQSH